MYRNDHEAQLARADALDAELDRIRAENERLRGENERLAANQKPAPVAPAPALAVRAPAMPKTPAAAAIEQRWRERAARDARLAGAGAESAAVPETGDIDICAFDAGGRHALISFGSVIDASVIKLDLERLTTTELFKGRMSTRVCFAEDGRSALWITFDNAELIVVDDDGTVHRHPISGIPFMMGPQHIGVHALSRDGSQLAIVDTAALSLFDVRTGTLAQRVEVPSQFGFDRRVAIANDGRFLVSDRHSGIKIISPDGKIETHEGKAIAEMNRSATLAIADDTSVRIGDVRWRIPGDDRVDALRFSPDDRWLAITLGSERVCVIDAATGELLTTAGDPYRPGAAFSNVDHVGFSADGTRLLVAGSFHVHPLSGNTRDGIAVYSLTERRVCGSIRRFGDEGAELHATTPYGPVEPLGKRGRAHRILTGEPLATVLDDELERGLDLADRFAFWGGLVAAKRLTAGAHLRDLVDRSRGLSSLLPVAVARVAAGQSAAITLPPSGLLGALETLAATPARERAALFEASLPALVAAEVDVLPRAPRGITWYLVTILFAIVVVVSLVFALRR